MTALRPEREDLYGGESPYESPAGARPYAAHRADPPTAPMPRLTDDALTAPLPRVTEDAPAAPSVSSPSAVDDETIAVRFPPPSGGVGA
ncbi:class E sortase, partial [Streptomyces tricolor]